jgi:hypothetical protein
LGKACFGSLAKEVLLLQIEGRTGDVRPFALKIHGQIILKMVGFENGRFRIMSCDGIPP